MGPWRSLVAHLHGMQGVRGSNPLGSTITPDEEHSRRGSCRVTVGMSCGRH